MALNATDTHKLSCLFNIYLFKYLVITTDLCCTLQSFVQIKPLSCFSTYIQQFIFVLNIQYLNLRQTD